MEGATNLFWVPLSNIYGRRIIILISLLLLTVFSFWCASAQSFKSLLAARVFQGIGGATAETLAPEIVGKIFFVHQSGRALVSHWFLSLGAPKSLVVLPCPWSHRFVLFNPLALIFIGLNASRVSKLISSFRQSIASRLLWALL